MNTHPGFTILSDQERSALRETAVLLRERADRLHLEGSWRTAESLEKTAGVFERARTWGTVARASDAVKVQVLSVLAERAGDAPAVLETARGLLTNGVPVGDCLPCARAVTA
jgi:hypothetical protein